MDNIKTFEELEVGDFINNLKQWGGKIVKKHDDGETVTIREMVWDDETQTEVEGDLAERTYDGYSVWTEKEETISTERKAELLKNERDMAVEQWVEYLNGLSVEEQIWLAENEYNDKRGDV